MNTINKELNLGIGEKRLFYPKITSEQLLKNQTPQIQGDTEVKEHLFSFFKSPISNTKPHKTVNLFQIFNAVKGHYYKAQTLKLRELSDSIQARKYKAQNFDYCTFSGIFSVRNDKALQKHSGLLCIDFDHLKSVDMLRNQLLRDGYFDTQLLFVSPSGNGLKWIIEIDLAEIAHADYFNAVANYLNKTYKVEVDKSGKDTSRACFLSFDPNAYINPQLLKQNDRLQ